MISVLGASLATHKVEITECAPDLTAIPDNPRVARSSPSAVLQALKINNSIDSFLSLLAT